MQHGSYFRAGRNAFRVNDAVAPAIYNAEFVKHLYRILRIVGDFVLIRERPVITVHVIFIHSLLSYDLIIVVRATFVDIKLNGFSIPGVNSSHGTFGQDANNIERYFMFVFAFVDANFC